MDLQGAFRIKERKRQKYVSNLVWGIFFVYSFKWSFKLDTKLKADQLFNLRWHFNALFKWVKHNLYVWNVFLRVFAPFSNTYIYSAPQPVVRDTNTGKL